MKKYNIISLSFCIVFFISFYFVIYFNYKHDNCFLSNEKDNLDCNIYNTYAEYCIFFALSTLLTLIMYSINNIRVHGIKSILTPLITFIVVVIFGAIVAIIRINSQKNINKQAEFSFDAIEVNVSAGRYRPIISSEDTLYKFIGSDIFIRSDTLGVEGRIKTDLYQIKNETTYFVKMNDKNIYLNSLTDSTIEFYDNVSKAIYIKNKE